VIKLAGVTRAASALILPMATGMSLTTCFLTLKQKKPEAKYVIWPRIDQKSCFKSITTAGLIPIVIENVFSGDELRTNLEQIEATIIEKSPETILCVFSTTSCFAPRGYDRVQDIAQICKKNNLYHVINNAYGLQDSSCCHIVNEAIRLGEVTYFVQSTDKNFMVPVGGAVVSSPNEKLVEDVSKIYPGRASVAPILDLFITFLAMGESGWKQLLKERKELYQYTKTELTKLASKHNEKVLQTPNNKISLALSLSSFNDGDPTFLGSMLFSRGCSGSRIVSSQTTSTIGNIKFIGYGSHSDNYPVTYMTVAASIGGSKREIDVFLNRLDKAMTKLKKNLEGRPQCESGSTPGSDPGKHFLSDGSKSEDLDKPTKRVPVGTATTGDKPTKQMREKKVPKGAASTTDKIQPTDPEEKKDIPTDSTELDSSVAKFGSK